MYIASDVFRIFTPGMSPVTIRVLALSLVIGKQSEYELGLDFFIMKRYHIGWNSIGEV